MTVSQRKAKGPRTARVPQSPQILVTVDQQTINEAIVRNSSHCMIAEAVKKVVPYARTVLVDLQSIRLTDNERGVRYTYLTPRVAQLALIAFDQGNKPKPFKITLSGGSVRRAAVRPHKKDWAVSLDDRVRIIKELQTARSERKATLEEIADEIDVAPHSLELYVSATPPQFSKTVAEKLAAWTDGREVPHKRPNAVPASLVSGKARLREKRAGDRSAPQVIGGKAPPVGNIARRRGFGLRTMVL